MPRHDWEEPGAHPVAPGVYRIPLPLPNDGLRAVNVYAIDGPDGPTLVDSGWAIPDSRQQLTTALASLGADLRDVQRFLVTHIHRDHYSQAVHLRREFGTRVTLGAEERWSLERTREPARKGGSEQFFRMRSLGAPEVAEELARFAMPVDISDWELPDDWFEPDDVVAIGERSLDVVATPGHTRGHVVFHDAAASLLFAGDHVLPTITPSIGFEPAFTLNPLGDFLNSLAVMRRRPDARLLPAHGPVADSVHARVDELVEHHEQRLDLCIKAVEWGATTSAQVAGELRWTRRERRLAELDLFNTFLAISETAAHLELLVAQGRLKLELVGDGEVRHYSLPG